MSLSRWVLGGIYWFYINDYIESMQFDFLDYRKGLLLDLELTILTHVVRPWFCKGVVYNASLVLCLLVSYGVTEIEFYTWL